MKKLFVLFIAVVISVLSLTAQEEAEPKKEGFQFTIIKENPATSVKDQYKSGTCWSFSTLSFLESELLRTGKGEYDLSEAFIVRNAYIEKAIRYVRFQGKLTLVLVVVLEIFHILLKNMVLSLSLYIQD